MSTEIYKANDKYNATLSSGYTVGQSTLYVSNVPDNTPTIVVLAMGTDDETVFSVTSSTVNSLTGVARLRGANVNLDTSTPVTCLNNEEFVNQYATQVGVTPWVNVIAGDAIEIDLDDGVKQRVILGADDNILSVANVKDGHAFIIKLTQDATGGRTVTWFSGITWAFDIVPTLTTTADRSDVFCFIQTDTDEYDGFVLGQSL